MTLCVGLEGIEITAKLVAIKERTNGDEARVAEWRMHDDAPAVGGGDADVAGEADRLLERRVGSPVELVLTGDARGFLCRGRRWRDDARRRRVIVIQELGEERSEAQLSAARRVV